MPGPLAPWAVRRLHLPLLVALLAASALAGGLAARFFLPVHDQAWQLVQQGLRQTYLSPAGYEQVVERRMGPRVEREVFQVWQDGPRRKVVQVEPATRAGFTTERSALVNWTYAPELRETLRFFAPPRLPFPAGGPHRHFFLRVHRAALEGSAVFEGQPVNVVALVSHGHVRQRFWIATGSSFVIKQERYDRQGHLLDTTVNRKVTRSQAMIRKALGEPRPKGPVVTDRAEWYRRYLIASLKKEAPFRFLAPERLPAGFTLVAASVADVGPGKVVALRFAGGKRPVSLFERPAAAPDVGPEPPPPPPGLPRRITVTRRSLNGVSVVLIGLVNSRDAAALLASLAPVEPARLRP